jgi:hypothetical protein
MFILPMPSYTRYNMLRPVFSICFEQLPENGFVKPKHVAIKYDFNDILK